MSSNYLTHFTHFKQLTQFTELTNKCEIYHIGNGRAYQGPRRSCFFQIKSIKSMPIQIQFKRRGQCWQQTTLAVNKGQPSQATAWLCLAVHFCNQNWWLEFWWLDLWSICTSHDSRVKGLCQKKVTESIQKRRGLIRNKLARKQCFGVKTPREMGEKLLNCGSYNIRVTMQWSPVIMSNTALSIVLSVLCVIIILRRGRTWGNTLAKSNIKVVSTFNKFSYSLFEGWKVIAQLKRFKLLDMRQPTSNLKAPIWWPYLQLL